MVQGGLGLGFRRQGSVSRGPEGWGLGFRVYVNQDEGDAPTPDSNAPPWL